MIAPTMESAGAEVVNPSVIQNLKELLGKRACSYADEAESFKQYLNRSARPPYGSRQEAKSSAVFQKVVKGSRDRRPPATRIPL